MFSGSERHAPSSLVVGSINIGLIGEIPVALRESARFGAISCAGAGQGMPLQGRFVLLLSRP
jgi:hypothetical protein